MKINQIFRIVLAVLVAGICSMCSGAAPTKAAAPAAAVAGPNGPIATFLQGKTVTLAATADGTLPFSYVWSRNGVVIPAATAAEYIIPNVQPAHAGSYVVVISNSVGSATTPPLTLIVELPAVPPTNPALTATAK